MPNVKARLFIAFWPLVTLPLLALIPYITPLIFIGACVLLYMQKDIKRLNKIILFTLWTLAIGAFTYSLIAFSAQVDAADTYIPAPQWTSGVLVAPIVAVGILIFAAVFTMRITNNK